MRVISIEVGRAGIVIPLNEVLPLPGVYLPDLVKEIGERYSFVSSPDFKQALTELGERGALFQIGKLRVNTTEHNIFRFTVLADALVVDANSTKFARLFLDDLFAWASKSHGLRVPRRGFQYFYLSQLVVEFEKSISKVICDLVNLSTSISAVFKATYNTDSSFDFSSFSLDRDRTRIGNSSLNILASFSVERRINEPYTSNRFFCTAPLHTEDHIRLLEELEAKITSG